MKFKIILTLFFLIINISSALAAKWKNLGNISIRPSEGIETAYYSKKGLVRGLFATSVELLFDLKEPNIRSEGTFNSTIINRKLNCKKRKFKTMKQTFFEKKMGKGKLIASTGEGEWQSLDLEKEETWHTVDGRILTVFCDIEMKDIDKWK